MAIQLQKGQRIDLTKDTPGLKRAIIGLGWDTADNGEEFDLDASAFLVNASGRCRNEGDFIFYNNLNGPGIHHTGDNRTGDGDGDDEQIIVTFDEVPADVNRIVVTVTIHDATVRHQNFGLVHNAFVRLIDADTDREILNFNLGEDFSIETSVVFCELYRHGQEWKFNAVGAGRQGGLITFVREFGLHA